MATLGTMQFAGQGRIIKKTASITVAATAAAGEEDISITDADAAVGDIIVCSPINAMAETGFSIAAAWVSAAGTIKVRLSNLNGSSLTGGANTLNYAIIRES